MKHFPVHGDSLEARDQFSFDTFSSDKLRPYTTRRGMLDDHLNSRGTLSIDVVLYFACHVVPRNLHAAIGDKKQFAGYSLAFFCLAASAIPVLILYILLHYNVYIKRETISRLSVLSVISYVLPTLIGTKQGTITVLRFTITNFHCIARVKVLECTRFSAETRWCPTWMKSVQRCSTVGCFSSSITTA